MHLKDLKNRINNSVKKLSQSVHQKKKVLSFKNILIVLIPVFFILILIFILNLSGLFSTFYFKKISDKNNILYRLAEDSYKKGYLENSAVYYQMYIDANNSKNKKVLGYKRLFEIAVVKKEIDKALQYLDRMQIIDSSNPEVYISRFKLLIRTGEYTKAKNEIYENEKKLKRSSEFKELAGVFYMELGEYGNAIDKFKKIKFNKREYTVNKKIILSNIALNDLEGALKYIKKIERKINIIGDKQTKSEFLLIKSLVKLLKGEVDNVTEDLNRAKTLSKNFSDIIIRLLIFTGIITDDPDQVFDRAEEGKDEFVFDVDLLKTIGDYFIYKSEYKKALYFYQAIEKLREYSKEELMIIANLHYKTKEYNNAIMVMESLFRDHNFKTPDLYKNLSNAYGKIKDVQKEIFVLKEGINEYPNDIDIYVRIAKVYIEIGDQSMAINYINEGKEVYTREKNVLYDKKLDILYMSALKLEDTRIGERELLDLREKETENPDYYFTLIRHYIAQNKFQEAKREMETVNKLTMSKDQSEIYNIFKLIMSLQTEDPMSFSEAREYLENNDSNNKITLLNNAIMMIFDKNFNKALNILSELNINKYDDRLKNKIDFLKAVCYYHKRDFQMSLSIIERVLENDLNHKQASYLKSLIYNTYGETQ